MTQLEKLPVHAVMLTNFVAPHKLHMYMELAKRLDRFTMLLSTPMEPNRRWATDWGNLDVRMLRTSTFRACYRHPVGFADPYYVHIPWNTIGVLKELRPDVILAIELGARSALSVLYKKFVKSTPLVLYGGLSEHTEEGRGFVRRGLRRWLVKNADSFAANGESGCRYLQRMGACPERTQRIHYPTLPGVFDKIPLDRNTDHVRRLLYVGRIIERKGILPFTEALVRWTSRNPNQAVEFTLAGYGNQQKILESLPCPDNLTIKVLGECKYDRIAQCYAAADVFVFPTLGDDWGMVVNEAMLAGVPVLGCTYSQAVDEMCVHGETGWPFQTDDKAGMEQAIDEALNTPPEQLRKMRFAARARVEGMTPQLAAEEWMNAIRLALQHAERKS